MAAPLEGDERRGDEPVRFLPHFEAKLEYLVHKLELKETRSEAESMPTAKAPRSVLAGEIGNQRVEHDHPGRRRAKP